MKNKNGAIPEHIKMVLAHGMTGDVVFVKKVNEVRSSQPPQGNTLTGDFLKQARANHLSDSTSVKGNNMETAQVKKTTFPKELYEGFDKLDKAGTLERIMENDLALYVALFHEKFGKYPGGGVSWSKWDKVDHVVRADYEAELKAYQVRTWEKMSWDEIYKADETAQLRELAPELYKRKFHAKYNRYPNIDSDY